MIKKIFFIIIMLLASYYVSFVVMYNQTLESVNSIVNEAISNNDYDSILSYNEFYIDTPMYYLEDDDYVVQINNSYNEELQSLTIIVVDRTMSEGEESLLEITCQETYSYNNIFTTYDDANIAVITLYEGGEDVYSLGSDCSLGNYENLLVKSNSGETIVSLDSEIGFIEEDDILNGASGYTAEELEELQYPNGLVKPIILPLAVLWISVIILIYIYKKFFKKN